MKNKFQYKWLAGLAGLLVLLCHPEYLRCEVRVNPADSARLTALMADVATREADSGTRLVAAAESLKGMTYSPVTGRDAEGNLQVSLSEGDYIGLLDLLCGIASVTSGGRPAAIEDLLAEIGKFAFRRGVDKGFSSIMLYGADWIGDNRHRGNIRELTEDYSTQYRTKSLDAVTRHREEYPALQDADSYDSQKMIEMGFRSHKIPHMRRESVENTEVREEMRDGDILFLLGSDPDYDVAETGVIVKRADGFHLIHFSRDTGELMEETLPLGRYLKKNASHIYGYRWIRLK